MNGALRLLRGIVRKARGATVVASFTDSFTGTAGTGLAAHTSDSGGSWTVHSGTPTLNGAGAVVATNFVASTDMGKTNVTLNLRVNDGGVHRAIFRLTDASNYWYFQYDDILAQASIVEVVAGVPTNRVAPVGRVNGLTGLHTLRVVTNGTGVVCNLLSPDGQTSVSFSPMASGLAATRFGFGSEATGTSADNITLV